jgi:Lar family restriction alleviation protein
MNKSCPFCGKNVTAIDPLNYTSGKAAKFRVKCQECGVATDWCETADEAWMTWNRREVNRVFTGVLNKDTFILNGLIYSRDPLNGNCTAQKEYMGKSVRIKADVYRAAYEECKKIIAGEKA